MRIHQDICYMRRTDTLGHFHLETGYHLCPRPHGRRNRPPPEQNQQVRHLNQLSSFLFLDPQQSLDVLNRVDIVHPLVVGLFGN